MIVSTLAFCQGFMHKSHLFLSFVQHRHFDRWIFCLYWYGLDVLVVLWSLLMVQAFDFFLIWFVSGVFVLSLCCWRSGSACDEYSLGWWWLVSLADCDFIEQLDRFWSSAYLPKKVWLVRCFLCALLKAMSSIDWFQNSQIYQFWVNQWVLALGQF